MNLFQRNLVEVDGKYQESNIITLKFNKWQIV